MVSRRGRRRVVAWVAVVAAVVLGGAGLVAASDPRGAALGGEAARYLPPDGYSDWVAIDGQTPQLRENGVTVGPPVLFEFPEIARTAAGQGYTEQELRTARHWTVHWTPVDIGDQASGSTVSTDFSSVTAAGVRLVMTLGAANSFVFQPGATVLAADVRPGASWKSEGEGWWVAAAADGGEPTAVQIRYSGEYAASDVTDSYLDDFAEPGCLEVDGDLGLARADAPTAGSVVFSDAVLWCLDRGIVASVTKVGDAAPVRSGPVEAPAFAGPSSAGPTAAWPAEWAAHAMNVEHVDPLFGASTLAISPALQPVELDGALAVADGNTGSLALFARSGDDLRRTAVLRPGGAVTALGAAEGLLLAATSQRRLVAYSPDGIRRWTSPVADVLVAPPIAGGDGTIVTGGVDGGVSAVDARTGEPRWATSVSSDAVSHLLRAGDKAIAVDRTGHLVALSLEDGSVIWRSEGRAIDAITATDDAVLVARDNSIDRLDAATGALRWSSPTGTGADAVAVVGDAVVVLTWDDVRAFSADDGAPRWRAPGAERAATDGRMIVLDGRGPTRVLDAEGETVTDLRIDGEDLGSARFLVKAPDGAWVVDSTSGTTWVGHD